MFRFFLFLGPFKQRLLLQRFFHVKQLRLPRLRMFQNLLANRYIYIDRCFFIRKLFRHNGFLVQHLLFFVRSLLHAVLQQLFEAGALFRFSCVDIRHKRRKFIFTDNRRIFRTRLRRLLFRLLLCRFRLCLLRRFRRLRLFRCFLAFLYEFKAQRIHNSIENTGFWFFRLSFWFLRLFRHIQLFGFFRFVVQQLCKHFLRCFLFQLFLFGFQFFLRLLRFQHLCLRFFLRLFRFQNLCLRFFLRLLRFQHLCLQFFLRFQHLCFRFLFRLLRFSLR